MSRGFAAALGRPLTAETGVRISVAVLSKALLTTGFSRSEGRARTSIGTSLADIDASGATEYQAAADAAEAEAGGVWGSCGGDFHSAGQTPG